MSKAKARARAKAKAPEKAKKRAAAAKAAAENSDANTHPGSFAPGNQSIKGPTSKANRNAAGGGARRGAARSK